MLGFVIDYEVSDLRTPLPLPPPSFRLSLRGGLSSFFPISGLKFKCNFWPDNFFPGEPLGSASLFFTGVVSFTTPGVAQSRPLFLPANAGVLAFP